MMVALNPMTLSNRRREDTQDTWEGRVKTEVDWYDAAKSQETLEPLEAGRDWSPSWETGEEGGPIDISISELRPLELEENDHVKPPHL